MNRKLIMYYMIFKIINFKLLFININDQILTRKKIEIQILYILLNIIKRYIEIIYHYIL